MLKQLLTLLTLCLSMTVMAQSGLKMGKVKSSEPLKFSPATIDDDMGVSVPGAPSVTSRMSGEEVELGSSYNVYSILLDAQNQAVYNPDLNSLVFIHRQNAGEDGGSGIISYDFSTDGGDSWDNDNKQVTPTLDLTGDGTLLGNGNRYPSGTIYNPPGNTDPANAYFVGVGPALHEDPVYGNGWGWEFVASSKLQFDETSVVENYYTNVDTTSFHPFALTANPDGSIWYVSTQWDTNEDPDAATTEAYGKMNLCRLDFNGTGFDRTVVETFEPNWGTVGDSMWHIQGDYNLAFSPDGMTGYLCFVTTDEDNAGFGEGIGVKPVLWKTTDGGTNWEKFAQVNYQDMPELLDFTYYTDTNGDGNNNDTSGVKLPYMNNMDMVVDAMGDLHIFAQMNSRSQVEVDSMGFGWFNADSVSTLFHFITDGVDWDAKFVDVLAGANGALATVAVTHRPQASRTADGMAVFATYLQTWDDDFATLEAANNEPDVFAYGYSLNSGGSAKKWLTDDEENDELALSGFYYWATMSPVSITNTPSADTKDYELPVVFGLPTPDSDLEPMQYLYLKGLGFDESELSGISSTEEQSALIDLTVSPNPATSVARLSFNLPEAADTEIALYDVLGKQVQAVALGKMNAGEHIQTINLDDVPAGLYFVHMTFGDKVATQKLQVN